MPQPRLSRHQSSLWFKKIYFCYHFAVLRLECRPASEKHGRTGLVGLQVQLNPQTNKAVGCREEASSGLTESACRLCAIMADAEGVAEEELHLRRTSRGLALHNTVTSELVAIENSVGSTEERLEARAEGLALEFVDAEGSRKTALVSRLLRFEKRGEALFEEDSGARAFISTGARA